MPEEVEIDTDKLRETIDDEIEKSGGRMLRVRAAHLFGVVPFFDQTCHGGLPDAYRSSSFALSFAVSIGTQKPS